MIRDIFKNNKVPDRQKSITVFFDVDGVLNSQWDWRTPFTLNPTCLRAFQMLDKAFRNSGFVPSYVLCSTWRAGKSDTGQDALQYDKLRTALASIGVVISGQTPLSSKTRQEEVEYYTRRNGVKDFIVLDDDASLYPHSERIKLFTPNYKTGLQMQDTKSIIKLAKQ